MVSIEWHWHGNTTQHRSAGDWNAYVQPGPAFQPGTFMCQVRHKEFPHTRRQSSLGLATREEATAKADSIISELEAKYEK